MKIAFVYDRVNKFGGAERVLIALHEIWPKAPLYTAVYDRKRAKWANIFEVKTSFLNKLPFINYRHEILPLITSYSFESFNFEGYDVVLSITSSDAKGIITRPETCHISYCLTPTRYLWSGYVEYYRQPGFGIFDSLVRVGLSIFVPKMRNEDYILSFRPDKYIAISKSVNQRLKKYYRKESEIIYPPVDTDKFIPNENKSAGEYYLVVSRLVPYKRIDYVIDAFNETGLQLKIIGSGVSGTYLKKNAKRNIEFIDNNLTDAKLCWYYQNCIGLIFPGEEDFGISAVEAQSCGKPVFGYKKGGLCEIIIPGITGELFEEQTIKELISVLKSVTEKRYLSSLCRKNAVRFDKIKFQMKMKHAVYNFWNSWRNHK
jgi:glycosyltransferase involved in cell wall biosynthesis